MPPIGRSRCCGKFLKPSPPCADGSRQIPRCAKPTVPKTQTPSFQQRRDTMPPVTSLKVLHHGGAGAAADLKELVRGEVHFGGHHKSLYSTDASLYQIEPI